MSISRRLVQVFSAAALITAAMCAGSGAGQTSVLQRSMSNTDSPRSMADSRVTLAHTVSWSQLFAAGNW